MFLFLKSGFYGNCGIGHLLWTVFGTLEWVRFRFSETGSGSVRALAFLGSGSGSVPVRFQTLIMDSCNIIII
jgi:hypothetical protein